MADIRELERECKALGQSKRIRIVTFLKRHRGATVGQIAKHIQCTFPTASHHIHVLRNAGIVLDRRRGKYVAYVLSPHMGEMSRTLLRIF